jgi:hypothetical protein
VLGRRPIKPESIFAETTPFLCDLRILYRSPKAMKGIGLAPRSTTIGTFRKELDLKEGLSTSDTAGVMSQEQ